MKILNKVMAIFLLISFISINGCGIILSGSKDDVYIYSNPKGAEVYINGYYMGETPLPMTLKSDKDYIVEFRKDGYEKKTKIINSTLPAKYIILDILFAFVPVIVDAATGGWYTLDEEYCNVVLEKTTDAVERNKKQSDIFKRLKQKDIEAKRKLLTKSDIDSVIILIKNLKNDIKDLEDKADSLSYMSNKYIYLVDKISADKIIALKRSIEYKSLANKNNDSKRKVRNIKMGNNRLLDKYYKLKEKYKEKAIIAAEESVKINETLSLLRIILNDLYDLVPELKP